jgi:muramoyltetrapeptide carboxypeptidase
VDYSPRARFVSDDGLSAGSAADRAADINEAFADPEVDAVLAAVGGMTTHEVLDHLDLDLIASSDKAFVGRSDNVFVHAALLTQAGLTSFYGAAFLPQFGEPPTPMPEIVAAWIAALMRRDTNVLQVADSHTLTGNDWRGRPVRDHEPLPRSRPGRGTWLRSGRSRGHLVGGELGIIVELLKANLIDLDGAILFWDVVNDFDDRVPRLWTELTRLADLSTLNGMLVGDNTWISAGDWERQLLVLVERDLAKADIPIGVGFDCGHYDPSWIFPFGDQVVLDSRHGLIIYPN